MTEPDAETPATSASAPRWRGRLHQIDWRAKARWFGAEYLIIVLGVLTAVGINAWWGDRQDAAKEQTYLRQLAADLAETERIVAERDDRMAVQTHAGFDRLLSFVSFSLLRPYFLTRHVTCVLRRWARAAFG